MIKYGLILFFIFYSAPVFSMSCVSPEKLLFFNCSGGECDENFLIESVIAGASCAKRSVIIDLPKGVAQFAKASLPLIGKPNFTGVFGVSVGWSCLAKANEAVTPFLRYTDKGLSLPDANWFVKNRELSAHKRHYMETWSEIIKSRESYTLSAEDYQDHFPGCIYSFSFSESVTTAEDYQRVKSAYQSLESKELFLLILTKWLLPLLILPLLSLLCALGSRKLELEKTDKLSAIFRKSLQTIQVLISLFSLLCLTMGAVSYTEAYQYLAPIIFALYLSPLISKKLIKSKSNVAISL